MFENAKKQITKMFKSYKFYTPKFNKIDGSSVSQSELYDILMDMFICQLDNNSIRKKYNLADNFKFSEFPDCYTSEKCKFCNGKMRAKKLKSTKGGLVSENDFADSVLNCYSVFECVSCKHKKENCDCPGCQLEISPIVKKSPVLLRNNLEQNLQYIKKNNIRKFNDAETAADFTFLMIYKYKIEHSKESHYIGTKQYKNKILKSMRLYLDLEDSVIIEFFHNSISPRYYNGKKSGFMIKISNERELEMIHFFAFNNEEFHQIRNIQLFEHLHRISAKKIDGKKFILPPSLSSAEPKKIIDYMIRAMEDFEFDNTKVLEHKDRNKAFKAVFDFITKSMLKNNKEAKITAILNPIEKTLEFHSDTLFKNAVHQVFKPYKHRRTLNEQLEKIIYTNNMVGRLFRQTHDLSFCFNENIKYCSVCGNNTDNMLTIGAQSFCDEHLPKISDGDDERKKYKNAIHLDNIRKKAKEKREKEIAQGIKFRCRSCKNAVRVENMSKQKDLCKGCAMKFAEAREIQNYEKEQKTKRELLEKQKRLSMEEKAQKAEKEKDMIAEFLAKNNKKNF